MELDNDLVKYRLVRLLLTSWLFPLLAYATLFLSESLLIVAVLLSLVGLVASLRLAGILFLQENQLTRIGLACLAILGIIGLVSNCSNTAILIVSSALNSESHISKDIKQKKKDWFGITPSKSEKESKPTAQSPAKEKIQPESKSPVAKSYHIKSNLETFIRKHLLAQQQGDLTQTMLPYANWVNFNGNELSKDSIKSDKDELFRKWPKRTIKPVGDIEIKKTGDYEWLCIVRTDFHYEAPATNRQISGQAVIQYELNQIRNHFSIVGEKREVVAPGNNPSNSMEPDKVAITNFINQCLADEAGRDVDKVMKNYASELKSYFGEKRTVLEIKTEKAMYYRQWPGWKETMVPGTMSILNRGKYWEIRFKTQFRAWNDTTRKRRSGTVKNTYFISPENGRLMIILQDGKVTLNP